MFSTVTSLYLFRIVSHSRRDMLSSAVSSSLSVSLPRTTPYLNPDRGSMCVSNGMRGVVLSSSLDVSNVSLISDMVCVKSMTFARLLVTVSGPTATSAVW